MYTRRSVRSFIRPLGLCVVLVFGALPAVTLACQWACEAPDGPATLAHYHGGHTEMAGPVDSSSSTTANGPTVRAGHPSCDHSILIDPGVTSAGFKVRAPSAIVVEETAFRAALARTHVVAAPFASPSPPGARSAPLALRI
jgi:hypothetical protein